MPRYDLYFNDILRAVELIEKSVSNISYEKFESNPDLIDATAMRLQIIGESIKKLPTKFKQSKKINWKDLQELRNIISHTYFKINAEIVFDTVKNYLPELKQEIQRLKSSLK